MRSSRLLAILILLQLRARLTAEALAQEFEVSVRTIYRDVEALSAAGVPVQAERGPGGGFQLLDGYRTRLTGLAADEAEALLLIGLPGPAAALGLGSAAARARGKLLACLPRDGGGEAARLGARFHLDPLDWYRAAEDPVAHLPALTRAVLDQRSLRMRYTSWTGARDWLVQPLGLVLKAGAWYLIARGAGKVRIFKVSSIEQPQAQPALFERPADFDLAAYWNQELQHFESRLRRESAQLQATPQGLERLAQLGAYARDAVRAACAAREGWSRVNLPIENLDQAALLLLGLGPEIRICEPAALRERVATLARQVAARMRESRHA